MKTLINAGKHEIIFTGSVNTELAGFIGSAAAKGASFFVIMDEHTHRHCFPVISPVLPDKIHKIVIGPGELNKNLHTCQVIWRSLLEAGADRNSIIINLGGGMVSDIGGFVAATYKRGIRFVNVPTSLLGMVDASCGGKTGIDLDAFKNMVGVFAFPETVIADPVFLKSLPAAEWRSGMAEILKHALIADGDLWRKLMELEMFDTSGNVSGDLQASIPDILVKAIRIKAGIVASDPFEKNERKFLNFGHTIGHALETWSLKNDQKPLSHGEAVAAGMICESFLSVKLCGLSDADLGMISNTIKKYFPVSRIKKESFSELAHFAKADKKSDAGVISYALLGAIGKPVLVKGVTEELLYESFHFYNGQ